MAVLDIVLEGDPRLRQKAVRIRQVDASIRKLADDMYETIPVAEGVAVAAPQVGVTRRLIVIRYVETDEDDEDAEGEEITYRLANPEIVRGNGNQVGLEGCLSIPGWVGEVPRFESVTVKGTDMENKAVRVKASGYLARIFQHEIDHLDGVLFTDRVEDKETLKFVGDDDDQEL
ncbi:MAG: peptide deformylase [Chloroflexia bacterium]|nr:peptide deformylase [Chloroflexia bacterium]